VNSCDIFYLNCFCCGVVYVTSVATKVVDFYLLIIVFIHQHTVDVENYATIKNQIT